MIEIFIKSLVSAWLWSLSWGWYHIPVNTFLLIFLLIFVARLSIVKSVFCSLYFTIGAFLMLTLCALIGGVWWYDLSYDAETWGTVFDGLQISLYLGFLYTIFQIMLSFFIRTPFPFRLILVLLLSNMITAALVYQFLPVNAL